MKLYTSRLILELTVRCNVITGYAIPYIWQSSGRNDTDRGTCRKRMKLKRKLHYIRLPTNVTPHHASPNYENRERFQNKGRKEENLYHTCKLHVCLLWPLYYDCAFVACPLGKQKIFIVSPLGKG
jgi:hypothetical protein